MGDEWMISQLVPLWVLFDPWRDEPLEDRMDDGQLFPVFLYS
jgi:hypothetical protein